MRNLADQHMLRNTIGGIFGFPAPIMGGLFFPTDEFFFCSTSLTE